MTKTWTAEELFKTLEDVKLGGSICLYTPEICEKLVPSINKILKLKEEKNAIILAHSYVVPEIIRTVADFTGDSYELSKAAKESDADTIIFAAVKFMADTAKLLNPNKNVLIPSPVNGCSLADSITAKDIQALKKEYPDYAFICYINTTAEVKAECDVCVTSSNVYDIVANYPNDKIYFLPDRLMAKNVIVELEKRQIKKTIKYWDGSCYVHEEYKPEMIDYIRIKYPGVDVVAHPECSDDIIEKVDYVGSTSQMVKRIKENDAPHYFMLTECGLTSRLQSEDPTKNFVGTCTMCKYMKSNSLENIHRVLESPKAEDLVEVDEETAKKAHQCIEKMFEMTQAISTKQ